VRIGIDATAVPPEPMGAGRYILYLIHELAKLDTSHEFVVFAQACLRTYLDDYGSEKNQIRWINDMSPPRRLVWEQVEFPRLIHQMKLDLLHSPHYTLPLSCPVPSVVTYHDMSFFIYPEKHTFAKRYFFPWMMRRSSKKADIIIADSENTRHDAIRFLNIHPEKIITVHLGYQENFRKINDQELLFKIIQQYNLPERFIFYAGNIEPRKNIPLLLTAFENLVQQGICHHLVMSGGLGWMYEDVLAQIDGMQSKARVHRIGHVPSTDLPALYNLADVFVYPSIYEGFGLPPLEGMACGTPVITSNISSMPEVVDNAGILVPPNDETALTRAILQVLEDDDLRKRLHVLGPQQAANFTWKNTAEKTLQIYQQVLSAR
jgi:glycosyltransferase involved in cell wall biosynthesis